ASLDEFAEEMEDEKYDLIVSNPPYFVPNKRETDLPENRKKARFYDSLPFEDLINYASLLLSENGALAVVIPFAEEEKILTFAKAKTLFVNRITRVRGTENAPVKRSLLQFSFIEKPIEEKELVLEIDRHHYTGEFKELVEEFYLKL